VGDFNHASISISMVLFVPACISTERQPPPLEYCINIPAQLAHTKKEKPAHVYDCNRVHRRKARYQRCWKKQSWWARNPSPIKVNVRFQKLCALNSAGIAQGKTHGRRKKPQATP